MTNLVFIEPNKIPVEMIDLGNVIGISILTFGYFNGYSDHTYMGFFNGKKVVIQGASFYDGTHTYTLDLNQGEKGLVVIVLKDGEPYIVVPVNELSVEDRKKLYKCVNVEEYSTNYAITIDVSCLLENFLPLEKSKEVEN